MVRPKSFGYNIETAQSNSFQQQSDIEIRPEVVLLEFDNMVRVLKSNNISVKIFEDKIIGLSDSIFPNNWIAQIPNNKVVVFPMATLGRRKEVRNDIVHWLQGQLSDPDLLDLTQMVNEEKYLEGTGSIIFDHQNLIAYACESIRTNIPLFEEFCKEIGYHPVSFESVDLDGDPIYHTNVMMTITEKIVIICLDSIQNLLERHMIVNEIEKSGKEILEINYQQMVSFAANSFEVINGKNESCLIMSESGYRSLSKIQIGRIEFYSRIIRIKIPSIELIGGGSVRCMLAGLFLNPDKIQNHIEDRLE